MSVPDRLAGALSAAAPLVIAVSGGVDSMTLVHAAHRLHVPFRAVHAVSPAVPEAASRRVKAHAERYQFALTILDAGEMADPRYLANPVNRCYFCKTNLYGRIRQECGGTIASGTNLDDLSDVRPGLVAADEHTVVHPYVEAEMGKADVYELAAAFGLSDVAHLPAQPCLASRIETGLTVTAETLAFIEAAEGRLSRAFPHVRNVRCRVTGAGVVAELSQSVAETRIAAILEPLCAAEGRRFAGVRPYRRGSAFLRATA